MSSLSVKNRVKLFNSKFVGSTKGFNNLPQFQSRKNNNNNNMWTLNNNNDIPNNLFVSPPGSPTGLNNSMSVASNVGSVASIVPSIGVATVAAPMNVPAASAAAAAAPVDPYAMSANKMAKYKAKWNKINANKKAAANAKAAAAAAPVAAASTFSPFNMYTSSAPVNQGPVYGPQLQIVMAKAFSKGASNAAKMGADYAGQQAAGKAAAEYAKVMKLTETNASGKVHYVGVEAEEADRALAAAKAANARRALAAANPVAPARHWAPVQTNHRGVHGKSRKNRRTNRKSRKNRK